MTSDHRITSLARRWGAGVGMATGAGVAAAVIGMTGAPVAHADAGSTSTDLGLLDSAEANAAEAFTLAGGFVPPDLADVFDKFEAVQTPLLSSDNSFFSGLGHVLFDVPDQQLNQTSDALLSAAQSFAADDPASITDDLDYLSAGFKFADSLFGSILPFAVGKIVDQLFDLGDVDTAGGTATDIDPNNVALSVDGIPLMQEGSATAVSSPGLFNVAAATGVDSHASATGGLFDAAVAEGSSSSASASGSVFDAAGAVGSGSSADASGPVDAALVMGSGSSATADGGLFDSAGVFADNGTAVAGPGDFDVAKVLSDGLTATATGNDVIDIEPSTMDPSFMDGSFLSL
jgi:hypothetical protein